MDNQTSYQVQCRENSRVIAEEITILKQLFEEARFKDFWQCVRTIGQMFKDLKPLARETREDLWTKYRSIIDRANKQREEREVASNNAKHRIHGEILLLTGTSTPLIWNPFGVDEVEEANEINETIRRARSNLSQILENIKGFKGILTKEDHQYCWDKWKEASDRLNSLYQELCDRSYSRLDSDISTVWNDAAYSPDLKEVLEEIKSIQVRLRNALLRKEQREELRNNLNQAWDEACSRLNAIRDEKHDAWVSRIEAWIDNRQEQIDKNQATIEKLKANISKLRDDISSSTNGKFIERAESWIEENEAQIAEKEGWISDFEADIEKNQQLLDDDKYRRR